MGGVEDLRPARLARQSRKRPLLSTTVRACRRRPPEVNTIRYLLSTQTLTPHMTNPADISRRAFLQTASAATAMTLTSISPGSTAVHSRNGPLLELSAREAVSRISNGD